MEYLEIPIHVSHVQKVFGGGTWKAFSAAFALQLYSLYPLLRVNRLRKILFNSHFLDKYFPERDRRETTDCGWPDDGNGMYSMKLSYKDWLTLNLEQRVYDSTRTWVNTLSVMTVFAAFGNDFWACFWGFAGLIGKHVQNRQVLRMRRNSWLAYVCEAVVWTSLGANLWVTIMMFWQANE